MDKENSHANNPKTGPVTPRPVLLTVLCLFSFIFFSLLSLLFFIFVFYSGKIASVRNLYVPEDKYSANHLLILFSAGLLFHLTAFAGTFLLWHRRKAGYYLLAPSCLFIALYQLLQPHTTLGTAGVYIFLIILFGLFFRRLH